MELLVNRMYCMEIRSEERLTKVSNLREDRKPQGKRTRFEGKRMSSSRGMIWKYPGIQEVIGKEF